MDKIKLIFVGMSHVGKTSIISQYMDNKFDSEYITTIGSDKSIKEIQLTKEKKIKLEIWDTPGQKEFGKANKIFMKNTKITIMVYDITSDTSFNELNKFYEEVDEVNGKENVFFVVVGNKSDLYENQVVTKETGEEYAKSIGALFFETTATDHECIENLFKDVVVKYIDEEKKKKEEKEKKEKEKKEKEEKEKKKKEKEENEKEEKEKEENKTKNVNINNKEGKKKTRC